MICNHFFPVIYKKIYPVFFLNILIYPQIKYDNHIFFDNSLSDSSYFYSSGSFIEPAFVELVKNKIPVEKSIFFSPPGSLRLHWRSGSGGSWIVNLDLNKWREREDHFIGNTLSFRCFSETIIPAGLFPLISVTDITGSKTDLSVPGIKEIPPLKWIQVKIPLKNLNIHKDTINLHKIKTISFIKNKNDQQEHTIYIDDIKIFDDIPGLTVPSVPKGLKAGGYDRHVTLTWDKINSPDLQNYIIYRSVDRSDFKAVGIQRPDLNRYADYTGETGKTFYYKIQAVNINDVKSDFSTEVSSKTFKMNDEELLTMVQEASFLYYWEKSHPDAGMSLENYPGNENLVAVGAGGFGIMALIAGIERMFISRDEGIERMLRIIHFIEKSNRFHGALPHFLDGRTGRVIPLFGKYDNGADLVETAFLFQGLLTARQYFNRENSREKEIVSSITKLWEEVEWDWFRREPESDFLFWHWSPDYAWHINHPLIGFNETMIVYLLAIASPTHSVPPQMYYSGWAGQSQRAVDYRKWGQTKEGEKYYNGNSYYGIKLDVGIGTGGPLFFTHYSFLGFDPRNMKDKYTDYFWNNRNIALINHEYCIDNPGNYSGYSDSCWGLTASDDPWGYKAHSPALHDDNGTITPTGALSSFPYTPDLSMKALKYFYYELGDKIWGAYGFRDAFNLAENWFADIYMGLNQATVTVMIENYRSSLLWDLFMSNPEINKMVEAVGFSK